MSEIQKCYVFAIGGTGARILEALTIQLAAGCGYEVFKNWEIVPIVIDLDAENGNTSTTRGLLTNYMDIQQKLNGSKGRSNFFKVPIKRLKDVSDGAESNTFSMPVDLTNKANLNQMIDYEMLSVSGDLAPTENLVDLLFSKEDLNMTLQHGFKGRPNIGSVVFGQFAQREKKKDGKEVFKNKDFSAFAHSFKQGDRIFVIGSIFGGTGAAGIPWLIKEIRNYTEVDAFSSAKIGLLSVMPYFSVSKNDNSSIDSKSFMTKTKSALRYYHKNLSEPNAIFYLADANDNMEHKNAEGGSNQKNKPHLVEFLGATALTKFLGLKDGELKTNEPLTLRYGMPNLNGKQQVYLDNFSSQMPSRKWINLPLTRFYLAHLLLTKVLKKSTSLNWKLDTDIITKKGFIRPVFDESFFQQEFYKTVEEFMVHFNSYLIDLGGESGSGSHSAFTPFMPDPSVGGKRLDDRSATSMNHILLANDLSNGEGNIDHVERRGNTTYYTISNKKIKWTEIVTMANTSINQVNLLTHQDQDIQRAMRYIEVLFLASDKFLTQYNIAVVR